MGTAYVQLMGKCAEVDTDEYQTRDGQTQRKVQVKLALPSMRDLLLCEMPENDAPPPQKLEQWEMDETWIVIQAASLRQLGFARKQARAGESAVGAMVIFQAVEIREATADERKSLNEHRKGQKIRQKQLRALRQAERKALKDAERQSAEPTVRASGAVEVSA